MTGTAAKKVGVAGVGLCTPGFRTMEAFLAGTADNSLPPAKGELLDKRNRRRASPQTKATADAYSEALQQSQLDPSTVASVFGSALGEATTMIGLLDQIWKADSMLSPMRFATSVHNAAAGVVSIATENRGFTTSLGADHNTPATALLEGIAVALAHDTPVIVACGDEAAPVGLVGKDNGWGTLAVAVALVPQELASPEMIKITVPTAATATHHGASELLIPDDVSRPLSINPSIGMLDLAVAVARKRTGVLRLDRGAGRGFCTELTR